MVSVAWKTTVLYSKMPTCRHAQVLASLHSTSTITVMYELLIHKYRQLECALLKLYILKDWVWDTTIIANLNVLHCMRCNNYNSCMYTQVILLYFFMWIMNYTAGTCAAAGLNPGCCTVTAGNPCFVRDADCSCHQLCHEHNDCCADVRPSNFCSATGRGKNPVKLNAS